MRDWPRCPAILELHAWAWLDAVGRHHGRTVDLGRVPAAEWAALAATGCDAIWLMGVWERSPAGRRIALANPELLAQCRAALPDMTEDDLPGSPYAVHRYDVDARLGGERGLAVARAELARHGLRLLLDYVPNHVALDHPWVAARSGHVVRGTPDDLGATPPAFFESAGRVVAHGRDPYFAPWSDTAQLDVFDPAHRLAAREALCRIADRCDGVRCDMAMLVLNDVFARTWGDRVGDRPATEYWDDLIPAVRRRHPGFLFVAEAYWGLESELVRHGFDFCYDKTLFDRLHEGRAASLLAHVAAAGSDARSLRFLENHDEERAAARFTPARHRAAAVLAYTLPGARLFHDGQFSGSRIRLPVQLGRRPEEPRDETLERFYRRLIDEVRLPVFSDGAWALCERSGWPGNGAWSELVAWCWRLGDERRLVVVNGSAVPAAGRVHLPWEDLGGRAWSLGDRLDGVVYPRSGDEMRDAGLYVALGPHGAHLFSFEPA